MAKRAPAIEISYAEDGDGFMSRDAEVLRCVLPAARKIVEFSFCHGFANFSID